jgi:hypothetical protein
MRLLIASLACLYQNPKTTQEVAAVDIIPPLNGPLVLFPGIKIISKK